MADAATTARKNLEAARDAAAEQERQALEQNSALTGLTAEEKAEAQKEGIRERVKQQAGDVYQALTDGNLPGAPPSRQFLGKDDIMQYEPLLSLGVDEFKARIAENSDAPVPEEKVAGLLELERSGQNRTDYVQAMCKRLKVKSPYEVTNAGPGYTNDTTPVTRL